MTKKDLITQINGSTIQHGKENNRIYLMKFASADVEGLIASLNSLAEENKYSKIFAKVPEHAEKYFLNNGYIREAFVPGFYKGEEGACFLAKYFSSEREENKEKERVSEIIELALSKKSSSPEVDLQEGFEFFECTPDHAEEIAEVYKQVFESYPFPIHEKEYILETMAEHVNYFGISYQNRIVALASAENDYENLNAEMTDFATLPEFRGHGFALYLLNKPESGLKASETKTLYTIARALSPGMNITFAKAGYEFAGTLVNNTNICGDSESMNVWYKNLY